MSSGNVKGAPLYLQHLSCSSLLTLFLRASSLACSGAAGKYSCIFLFGLSRRCQLSGAVHARRIPYTQKHVGKRGMSACRTQIKGRSTEGMGPEEVESLVVIIFLGKVSPYILAFQPEIPAAEAWIKHSQNLILEHDSSIELSPNPPKKKDKQYTNPASHCTLIVPSPPISDQASSIAPTTTSISSQKNRI
jgi:hypothetical protein